MEKSDIKLISASAGSGKTYRLMQLVHEEVSSGLKADGLLAVTYTKKAAEELKQRIREKLVESGNVDAARSMASARIGTVHGICGDFLKRFAFEDGSSPRQKIIDEVESARLFNNSLNEVLTDEVLRELSDIAWKFSTNTESLISEVRKLALIIRQNNLSDLAIQESLKLSLDKIRLVTESPRTNSNQANLVTALKNFIASHPTPPDTTKVTATAHKTVEEILNFSKSSSRPLSWYLWVKLAKVEAGAKSRDFFNDVNEAARAFLSNGELRVDFEKMINLAFKLASTAAEKFSAKKKNLGVLDYGDLEEKTLAILDKESVRAELKSELDVLFVDEFQDTNPIQLAIFLKLSSLCKKTVWVGDLKQSIYRFRGADPELMKAVLIELGKGNIEVLKHNWRSVPEIINFVNELFSLGFVIDQIPAEQVVQEPKWSHPIQTNGLEVWDGTGKNKGERTQKLANGILGLLNQKIKITDRETEDQRSVRPGDIAILCRSNEECVELSHELGELGVASSVVGGRLLDLPEVSLALASFRYLINSRDTVAAAEIALALGSDKDQWLQNAIDRVNPDSWNPALERVSKARDSIMEMSIREKLDLALSSVPIDAIIEKLANGDNRTFHLSALRQQAKKYEDVCQASFIPCTDTGFLDFLEEVDPPIPSTAHTEAVSIVTYHSSKGLEWPIVVMSSLDKAAHEPTLFQVRQEMIAGAKFQYNDPLANRIITYLPWAFGDYKKIDELDALTSGLPELAALRYAEESETRRLLYVGMTRAREKLVLLNTIKKTVEDSMLGVLSDNGQAILGFEPANSKICVGKTKFDCVYKGSSETSVDSYESDERQSIVLLQGTPLVSNVKPLYLQPSYLTKENVPSLVNKVKVGRSFNWGSKLLLKKIKDIKDEKGERADVIGSAVHLFLGADDLNGDPNKRSEFAQNILKKWIITETLEAESLIQASDRFYKTIQETWPNSKIYREVPMEMNLDGSVVRGAIDSLVIAESEVAVIDHKTLTASFDEAEKISNHYQLQLAAYAQAAKAHFSGKKVTTWIHNPDGWMCEILLDGI